MFVSFLKIPLLEQVNDDDDDDVAAFVHAALRIRTAVFDRRKLSVHFTVNC